MNVWRKAAASALLAFAAFGCVPRPIVAPTAPTVCRECRVIEHRLVGKNANCRVRGETLQMAKTSTKFYRDRAFAAAWSADGQLPPSADALIHELQGADWEGLNPVEYHLRALETIRRKWPKTPTPELTADMDILLTDAYLLYASHLIGGRTNVSMAKAQWNIIRKKADPVDLLNIALQSGEISESLRTLAPPYEGYARLKTGLARYRVIARAGGWPTIPDGPLVKPGASDSRIPRCCASGSTSRPASPLCPRRRTNWITRCRSRSRNSSARTASRATAASAPIRWRR